MIPSVMHYGEFAFRNKEYSGLMAQLTRTIYPNLFSWGAIKVGSRLTFPVFHVCSQAFVM